MFNRHLITLDIDWAPDEVIAEVSGILLKKGVKSTWFITHDSPAIRKLADYPELFELGLHPNFNTGSSQGDSPNDVMMFLKKIYPHSSLIRTHGLIQSTDLLAMLTTRFNIEADVSIFLPGTPDIIPHEMYFSKESKSLIRIPYFWEDDFEFYKPVSCWSFDDQRYHCSGLKVFNFHPIHVVLNSQDEKAYQSIKSGKKIQDSTMLEIKPMINKGIGTRTLFVDLVDYLSKRKELQFKIGDIVREWKVVKK